MKEFQEKAGVKFELTICDEAHRTASHEGSLFSLAAEPNYIDTVKKLFMTATPKIYSDKIRKKAEDKYATVPYSMDDEDKYGPEFYRFGFGEAVDKEVLCDYKVLILAMKEGDEGIKDITNLISSTDIAQEKLKALCEAINRAKKESSKNRAKEKLDKFNDELATLPRRIQGAYIDLSDLRADSQGKFLKTLMEWCRIGA